MCFSNVTPTQHLFKVNNAMVSNYIHVDRVCNCLTTSAAKQCDTLGLHYNLHSQATLFISVHIAIEILSVLSSCFFFLRGVQKIQIFPKFKKVQIIPGNGDKKIVDFFQFLGIFF